MAALVETNKLEVDSPLSPFYIHPSESPSLVLVSVALTGNNYLSWSQSMRMVLQSKNKLSFVDGSIDPPSKEHPNFQVWQRCNTLVHSWIMHSVSPSIAQSIIWIDEAVEVWRDLKERIAQGGQFRLLDLQEEIYSYRQGSLNVNEYFTQMKILWDEFFNLQPIPQCKCNPKCSCGTVEVVRQYMNNDCVIRFLRGLNESFNTVKSQIMLIDPLSSIKKVFSMVVQSERQSAHYYISTAAVHHVHVNKSQAQSPQISSPCKYSQ